MVLFDGVPAPLFFVRDDQINAQVPYGVDGKNVTSLQVVYGDNASNEVMLPVAPSAPGVFVYQDEPRRAVALNQDGSLNSPTNPVAPGEVVVLFATGEGQTDIPGEDGRLSEEPYPSPVLPVELTFRGGEAKILFVGATPGFAGLLQVNGRIPFVAGGDGVPLKLKIGEAESQQLVGVAVTLLESVTLGHQEINSGTTKPRRIQFQFPARDQSFHCPTKTLDTLAILKGGERRGPASRSTTREKNTKQTQFRTTSLQPMGYRWFPSRRVGRLSKT